MGKIGSCDTGVAACADSDSSDKICVDVRDSGDDAGPKQSNETTPVDCLRSAETQELKNKENSLSAVDCRVYAKKKFLCVRAFMRADGVTLSDFLVERIRELGLERDYPGGGGGGGGV